MMEQETAHLRGRPFLILVVPCYNEEAVLPATMDALANLLEHLKSEGLVGAESLVCYVDDGSQDGTWQLLEDRHKTDKFCRAIKFAANAGHQNAVWAGMDIARKWGADCAISLDADLQDDINVVGEMVADYVKGSDIVYGVRDNRATDTWFKRTSAHVFYALMKRLNLAMIPDHADYRLVSRQVLEALGEFGERNLFLRGLFPQLGFRASKVYYHRKERLAGESKYPIRKMCALAWQGITSASAAPLRIAGILSFASMLIALLISVVSLWKYAMGVTIQGWTSLIIVVLFLGGAQLFCLAIMGEYIAKIFTEVRHRPRYIIEKYLD